MTVIGLNEATRFEMYYVKFLKPPPTQVSSGQIFTVVWTIETDLGDAKYPKAVPVMFRNTDPNAVLNFLSDDCGRSKKIIPCSAKAILLQYEPNVSGGVMSSRFSIQTSKPEVQLVFEYAPLDGNETHPVWLHGRQPTPDTWIIPAWSMPVQIVKRKPTSEAKSGRQAERLVTIEKKIIRIREDACNSIARHIWDCGLGVCHYLSIASKDFRHDTVVELGSGTGLAGIYCAHLLKPKELYLTDLPDAMEIMEQNAQLQNLPCIKVKALEWGPGTPWLPSVDLVLLTDVLYNQASHDELLTTLDWLMGKETKVLLAYKERHPDEREFFKKIEERQWSCVQAIEDTPLICEIYWIQKVLLPLRQYSATTRPKKTSFIRKLAIGTTAIGMGATVMYHTDDRFRHVVSALERCGIAGAVGTKVALDYKRTLSQTYSDHDEREAAKRACHKRCAEHVLAGLQKLGGIYVKLGQHVSALVYVLPPEWTSTMAVLQDRCDPSTTADIKHLFITDYGRPVEEVFDEFDWEPIGVASLAQVHHARLRDTQEYVAVKLQHPALDEFCRIDLDTVSFIFGMIKRVFPDFGFEWVAEEMRESLPRELDFTHEAANARKVEANFAEDRAGGQTTLTIPNVLWARRRIMCMEFIEGARIDNLDYMKQHNIDPKQVSAEMTRVFSKMIFIDGFVHCDPHPGNVIIRPAKDPKRSKYNFDLVLLDHGLYRTLTDELRMNYAQLWTSLIKGDEQGIKTYSLRVGGTDGYRLFACMLTGRDWNTINSVDLSSTRTAGEMQRISGGALDFLIEVADILARMPRPVLLLLKTNDLLRVVDETLDVSDQRMTYVIMGNFCAKAVWRDTKQLLFERIRIFGCNWDVFKKLTRAWWEYHSLEFGLWFYEFSKIWMERLKIQKLVSR
ncbi:hypothetical protein DFQ29_005241 [Apophysomyces sp. BC1021]|nr:hypothetical protein DFQ29_005241 [Apophysomyces sp. BC1021]